MGSFKDNYTKEQEKERLKGLGNPYASLSMLDDDGDLGGIPEKHRQYLSALQNPYAFLAEFYDADELASVNTAHENVELLRPKQLKLPKHIFRSRCRCIFSYYIPSEDNGKLRKDHRDFITRNESRSPEERYLLLEELKKYDLSSFGSFQPHFNRENDVLTKKKLTEIERKVLGGQH